MGSLAGALTAAKIAARIGQGPAIRVPIAIAAPFQLLTPMAQPGWLLWVAAFAYLVISCCVVVNNVTQVGFRQRLTPEHLLGRMNATMRFLVWGTTPIGALIGVLGQLLGPPPTLWLAAIGAVIPVLPLILSPLRYLRELPTMPLQCRLISGLCSTAPTRNPMAYPLSVTRACGSQMTPTRPRAPSPTTPPSPDRPPLSCPGHQPYPPKDKHGGRPGVLLQRPPQSAP
ncbi:hypothetical protein [Streptosporangium lutulentum]|uniref:Transmembrane secretion effector n=1 Tax=Streptosporangium lutulentum TaxID=1461250 RepID=A0ABT9QA86_9ACTN|nr:hypothetical protein [Streptosporangium lutulentum]MDP9843643.1 hypothetical protein [Streptosporangium lutulentum]